VTTGTQLQDFMSENSTDFLDNATMVGRMSGIGREAVDFFPARLNPGKWFVFSPYSDLAS
jgi:hypothetical protein